MFLHLSALVLTCYCLVCLRRNKYTIIHGANVQCRMRNTRLSIGTALIFLPGKTTIGITSAKSAKTSIFPSSQC